MFHKLSIFLNCNSVPSQIWILSDWLLNRNSSPPELYIIILVVIYCWSLRPNAHIKRSYPFETQPKLAVSLSHVILTSFFCRHFLLHASVRDKPNDLTTFFYGKARNIHCMENVYEQKKFLILSQISGGWYECAP